MSRKNCKQAVDDIVSSKYDEISTQLRNRFKQRYPSIDRSKDEIFSDAYMSMISSKAIATNQKDPTLITEAFVRQSLYLNAIRKAKSFGYFWNAHEHFEGDFESYTSSNDVENDIIFSNYIDTLPDDEKQMCCLLIQGYSLNEIWTEKVFKSRFETDKIFRRLKRRLNKDFYVSE